MGSGKCLGEIMLEDGAPGGVGARFKECPEAASRVTLRQPFERLADGGGMMPEVVDDRDPVHHASDFLTAPDPSELQQRLTDYGGGDAVEMRC